MLGVRPMARWARSRQQSSTTEGQSVGRKLVTTAALTGLVIAATGGLIGARQGGTTMAGDTRLPAVADIHLIKHVVVIMQENRSFDSYFGTYPGADGIPMQHGVPTVCVPDPST